MTLPALHMGRAGVVPERDKERNMAAVLKSSGANSASYKVDGASSVLNGTQWAALPAGRLKDLLNKTGGYASLTSFFDALCDEGGAVFVTSDGAAADAVWSLAATVPTLTVTQAGAGNFGGVRIALSYSASA